MEINKLRSEVKTLCDKIDALDPLDEFTLAGLWDELAILFSQDENLTLTYFKECYEPAILYNLSSIIGDTSLILQSLKFVELIKNIAPKNEQFWGRADWVISLAEDSILDAHLVPVLKKYKIPTAWYKRNALLIEQTDKFESKISNLRELSTRRPLLAREQTELAFLEKIQATDSLSELQTIDNELINAKTDDELKTQIKKCIADKKNFY